MGVCENKLCNNIISSDKDNLGRWSCLILCGTLHLGVITMFPAVKSLCDISVFRQQQQTLDSIDGDPCPRESITKGHFSIIKDWK